MRTGHMLGVAVLAAFTLAAGLAHAAPRHAESIKIERVKPSKEHLKTMRFLRSNVAFLRAQLDALREKRGDRDGQADVIDPGQLLVDRMMAEALAANGTADSSSAWLAAQDYLGELQALLEFESRLDEVTELLDEQADRIANLQRDYLERQGTAVMVLATGGPRGRDNRDGAPSAIVVGRDDERTRIGLADHDVAALGDGGLVRVWYEFVEPREQVLEVAFEDAQGTRQDPVYVTVSPEPEMLTFVELDLSGVNADGRADKLTAKTWTGADEWLNPATISTEAGGPSR